MATNPVVDLGYRRRAVGHRGLGGRPPRDRRGPFSGGAPGRGEVARILGLDPLDEQRLGARQRGVITGGEIERTRERVAARQIHRGRRGGLQHPLGMPQFGVDRFGQHRPDPLVRFVAGQLLAARCQHGQLRLAPLVETLAVDETIRAAADFGNDLGADISVGRLDLLDFLLRRAVLVLEQQVQRLDHGGLADLVGAAHHHHSMIGEFDVTVCDAAVIGQGQPVQLHAAPRSASRSNSASAAWASTADSSSPPRAVATSSSTAAAANPPMPRSVNSASTGITARSV
ncbi:Uncharacterised protein [Mycobacterium tuberculosis]|nr:Uncharacterised protein [Mycobacterium tuberculosis]